MTSRRKFLAALPALSAAAALQASADTPSHSFSNLAAAASGKRTPLESGWRFCFNPSASHDPEAIASQASGWQSITVPHTWQALNSKPDYVGVAWYTFDLDASLDFQEHFVRIEFEAVFHSAHIYLNGAIIGEHLGKGYTAFQCDLSGAASLGKTNTLLVRVDNSPVNTMLPRMQSYDWANDGGIIRPVSLLISPKVFIERIEIESTLDLKPQSAQVAIRAIVRNTLSTAQSVQIDAGLHPESSPLEHHAAQSSSITVAAHSRAVCVLQPIHLDAPRLWHFDSASLYVATATLRGADATHQCTDTFGIRSFEIRGSQFLLNGQPVRLMGVERMAGSNPEFGMAETSAWIEANHRDMKELNCVFTRVHWAQDRRVLDCCDRLGILIQEEVPAWGSATFQDISAELQRQLTQNGIEQLREMIARDRNHPSIVSWGLCNEVDGKNPISRSFAKALSVEARKLDPSRLQTYASNSLGEYPVDDMAGEFDFISTNEYYGSWQPGGPKDVHDHLDRIRKAFPGKPIVVSEYGWCECQPIIPPGDQHRMEIIDRHTEVFRDFPEVAGAIYFDYNDYRTLVGDKGNGAFRQRVHGVVDLYANRKPSFNALRAQFSPIESIELRASDAGSYTLRIASRNALPSYTLCNYRVRWIVFGYDDLPMDGRIDELKNLEPGSTITLTASFPRATVRRMVVDVLSPIGDSVATAELKVS